MCRYTDHKNTRSNMWMIDVPGGDENLWVAVDDNAGRLRKTVSMSVDGFSLRQTHTPQEHSARLKRALSLAYESSKPAAERMA
jgi:hypothetical protein